jgi:hypothetical protein
MVGQKYAGVDTDSGHDPNAGEVRQRGYSEKESSDDGDSREKALRYSAPVPGSGSTPPATIPRVADVLAGNDRDRENGKRRVTDRDQWQ